MILNVVLLGDIGAGKESLMRRFANYKQEWAQSQLQDEFTREITYEKQKVRYHLSSAHWNYGCERFGPFEDLAKQRIREAHVILLVFDLHLSSLFFFSRLVDEEGFLVQK